jgi:hypothetical protein
MKKSAVSVMQKRFVSFVKTILKMVLVLLAMMIAYVVTVMDLGKVMLQIVLALLAVDLECKAFNVVSNKKLR